MAIFFHPFALRNLTSSSACCILLGRHTLGSAQKLSLLADAFKIIDLTQHFVCTQVNDGKKEQNAARGYSDITISFHFI